MFVCLFFSQPVNFWVHNPLCSLQGRGGPEDSTQYDNRRRVGLGPKALVRVQKELKCSVAPVIRSAVG